MKKLIHNKKFLFLFVLFLGIITSLSLPPYNYLLINFLTLNIFFLLLINKNLFLKKIDYFLFGWLFGFGYFFSSLYWITISLTFDTDFKILIPIALIAIPGFLALFFAFATLLFSLFLSFKIFNLVLIFSILFAIFEFIRGTILTGFPWNLFVYSFSDNLLFLQTLSLFGTYGLNLICITFFLIPSILILKKSKFDLFSSIILIFIFVSFFIFGNFKLNNANNKVLFDNDLKIKVISSKIKIDRFYDIHNEEKIIKNLVNLSKPNKNLSTIFIWPEGILTSSFLRDIKKYQKLFDENFSENHLIVLGGNDIQHEDKIKIYNSLVVLDNKLNIISIYHKNKLVPFGEFLPFENTLSKIGLRKITNNYQSFSYSKEREIINIKNLNILPLICYEIIYSGNLSDKDNYDLVINISEDGWFGQSIGPKQHFVHSVFRSIEEGKSIIRSTNNGISALVSPEGKILKIEKSTEGGVFEVSSLKKPHKNTFFSIHGNNIFFYLLVIYITLIFFLKRIGR